MGTLFVIIAALGVLLLAIGWQLWQKSRRLQKAVGLPTTRVVYEDVRDGTSPEEPLVSHRWRLAGKPDYLVSVGGHIIPVEVKTAPLPASGQPYYGHVLQLGAYCLLVEEVYGARPPYGYIRYRDKTVQVPYTDRLRGEVIRTLQAMHRAASARSVVRSHQDAWRCARCGVAYACGRERLL